MNFKDLNQDSNNFFEPSTIRVRQISLKIPDYLFKHVCKYAEKHSITTHAAFNRIIRLSSAASNIWPLKEPSADRDYYVKACKLIRGVDF